MMMNNINNPDTKKLLLGYLSSILNLQKYRYKIVKSKHDLEVLYNHNFCISVNYTGINSLLAFIKLKDTCYSFTVDKKSLTYSLENNCFDKVKLYPVKIKLDEHLYDCSIFDGTLIIDDKNIYPLNNKQHHNNCTDNCYSSYKHRNFIINDVYFLRGKDMAFEKIQNKLLNVTAYFDSYYIRKCQHIDKSDIEHDQFYGLTNIYKFNTFNLIVNKLYELSDISHVAKNVCPKLEFAKGISFVPETTNSTNKLIYMFESKNINAVTNEHKNKDGSHKSNAIQIFGQNLDCVNIVSPIDQSDTNNIARKTNISNNIDSADINISSENDSMLTYNSYAPNKQNHIKNNICHTNNNDQAVSDASQNKIENKPANNKNAVSSLDTTFDINENKLDTNKLRDGQIFTFYAKKTDLNDVYKLYLVKRTKDNHKTSYKKININIAYIPDISTSKMCIEAFKSKKNDDDVLFNCKYIKDKNKWLPISQNETLKLATIINEYLI